MELKEYFRFTHDTNCYPADKMDECLSMGLISEVGEIADKVKKNYRDHKGNTTDKDIEAIALECGDVMWYLSEMNDNFDTHNPIVRLKTSLEENIINLAFSINDFILSSDSRKFMNCIYCIHEICDNIGYTLSDVLDMNIAKLKSRKERNAIGGSGDYR